MAPGHEYDAIVLDVMLPGINGFETCRRLREARRLGARADAHRARLGRGPRRGARHRRRRLPREAVRVRGAAGAPARAGPARRARAARPCSRSATCGSTRRPARSGAADARSSSRPRSSRCSRRSCAGPARCFRACTCSSTPGTSPTTNRSNVVDVYVRHLRRKIDEPFGRRSLETVRGAGYRLRADDGRERAADPAPRRGRVRRRDGGRARG